MTQSDAPREKRLLARSALLMAQLLRLKRYPVRLVEGDLSSEAARISIPACGMRERRAQRPDT